MYYCLNCCRLHPAEFSPDERIYSSGFRYIEQILYKAGICSPMTGHPHPEWRKPAC